MQGDLLRVSVRVHGSDVREYQHEGKIFIEGRKGSEFGLRVKNLTGKRVLVVGSVDGLSIMTGKEASYDSGGYILSPHEFMDIPGWRLSNDEIASFFFNKFGKSYAAQMGKPRNVGVVGFAVFHEFVRPQVMNFMSSGSPLRGRELYSANAADIGSASGSHSQMDSMDAGTMGLDVERGGGPSKGGGQSRQRRVVKQAARQELGTGFGERKTHQVREVPFEKASQTPDELFEISYDSRQGLSRRGVDLDQKPRVTGDPPNAFPGEKGCTPPAGWNG